MQTQTEYLTPDEYPTSPILPQHQQDLTPLMRTLGFCELLLASPSGLTAHGHTKDLPLCSCQLYKYCFFFFFFFLTGQGPHCTHQHQVILSDNNWMQLPLRVTADKRGLMPKGSDSGPEDPIRLQHTHTHTHTHIHIQYS